jgi:hypothetical protein
MLSRRAFMPTPWTAGLEKVVSIPAVGFSAFSSIRGTCSVLADRRREKPDFLVVEFALPLPAHVTPGRGLLMPARPVEDAGFSPSPGRLSTDGLLIGEPDKGGEFAREDLSERRVSEKELNLLLCLGISTAGVAISAGPSTPVLTMYVLVSAFVLGDLLGVEKLGVSDWLPPSLLECPLCSLPRIREPSFPRPRFSGGDCRSTC